MNRKTKKQIRTVAVLLFFLAAGVWYFFYNRDAAKEEETGKEIIGVLDSAATAAKEEPLETGEPEEIQPENKELVVYVCGAVNEPGIYTLTEGSRLYEAVALAGGFSSEADTAYHNLARSITDSERIYILSVAETKELTTQQQVNGEEGAAGEQKAGTGLINLNTATAEQLMELPGIGEAKAETILAYRAKVGVFSDVEEIMNVSGIGEAMFEKIKDKITVK